MVCAKTSSPLLATIAISSSSPLKSGVRPKQRKESAKYYVSPSYYAQEAALMHTFHEQFRTSFLQKLNGLCKVHSALIRQLIAVDGGEHDIVESPGGDGLGDVLRLVRVKGRGGPGGLHAAEGASPCAGVSHDHDGGGGGALPSPAPALADVGTPRLLTHSRQLETSHRVAQLVVVLARGNLRLQPGRLGENLLRSFALHFTGGEGRPLVLLELFP